MNGKAAIEKGKLTRRSFFKYGLRLSILGFLAMGFAGRNNIVTKRVNLAFANLPRAFDGFRIVQISDLHASFWVGRRYLDEVIARVNDLAKDIVVITGDIITGSVNDFWKRWLPSAGGGYIPMVAEVLNRLNTGRKFAVLGNHDQCDGKDTERQVVGALERIGIEVLRNRSETIHRGNERITIAGTDDIWHTYNIHRALKDIRAGDFTIMLCHSPDVREDLGTRTKVELVLCGHTHGGQVAIPYLSYRFIPIKRPDRYLAGLVQERYGYTYVNRGIGTIVFPLRLGAPPEITSIKLIRQ